MKENVFQVALAGLLHELDPFALRAGASPDEVADKVVPNQWQPALTLARAGEGGELAKVVRQAAAMVAGGPQTNQAPPEYMHSIFSHLVVPDGTKQVPPPADPSYLPLEPLRVEPETAGQPSPIFPLKQPPAEPGHRYAELWQQFTSQAQRLRTLHSGPQADPITYLNSLLNLLQQYTWAIPSSYYPAERPDVSLYDHSRMTSALAVCLLEQQAQPEGPAAHLVGGDISGVQDFIYTITSSGATSGLRGRSMYLQLLTEAVAHYVLDQLDLPLTHLIYGGGGHFYLLAPPPSAATLKQVRQAVSRILLHHHQGDLYLALAHTPLSGDQFALGQLPSCWRELTQRLQVAKQQQFAELEQSDLVELFTAKEHGGNEEKVCAVCQREHRDTKKVGDDDNEVAKCPACRSYEALGEKLRRARYYSLDQITPQPLAGVEGSGAYGQVLTHFGYRPDFHQETVNGPGPGTIRRALLALNDDDVAHLSPTATQTVGRHFLVNITPLIAAWPEYEWLQQKEVEDLPRYFKADKPPIKTFGAMTKQAQGIDRLGILRMDVDNLGQIFSKGLGQGATLSRIASLSFAVSLFFEGWVAQIAAHLQPTGEPELIYSIYSGGDDLFFVGAWQLMPALAERIREDLRAYSGAHPGIHLSGGIALVPAKYPLYQAAEDAHQAEQAAKTDKQADDRRKNALNFLGKTIPWAQFSEVQGYRTKLQGLVETPQGGKPKAPRALLHRLARLYLDYEQVLRAQAAKGETRRPYWGRGQWYGAYSLARMAQQHKAAAAEITEIRKQLQLEEFSKIEWIGPAARWAELLIRNKQS